MNNNMVNGNNMYGGGMYQPIQQQPINGNWLGDEMYSRLLKEKSSFTMSVSDLDIARGQCNHRKKDGTSSLIVNDDGSYTCTICGCTFVPSEFSEEDIRVYTKIILDILNNIKLMYISLDPNAALGFFQIIPFIEKIPEIYRYATNDFKRYEGVSNTINDGYNPFMMMSALMGGGMMMPNQSVYNNMPQQGMAMQGGIPQQPQPPYNMQQNPLYQQQYMPQGFVNPMGTVQPQQGMQMQGMGMQGNAPQQPQPTSTVPPVATPAPETKDKK